MFENVDGRRTDDGRTTDAGVIGILIAHLGAFGSGELIKRRVTGIQSSSREYKENGSSREHSSSREYREEKNKKTE